MDYPLLTLLLAYLIGSIPCGLIFAKLAGLGDIRRIGSGNIGATNVLRTGNKAIAALTLVGDVTKGAAAIWLSNLLAPEMIYWAAIMVVIGHDFSCWLKGKGGKGVATSCGVLLALHLPLGLITAATWLLVFLITRISSLAALAAAITAPSIAYYLEHMTGLFVTITLLSLLLIIRHIPNIRRLLQHEESTV